MVWSFWLFYYSPIGRNYDMVALLLSKIWYEFKKNYYQRVLMFENQWISGGMKVDRLVNAACLKDTALIREKTSFLLFQFMTKVLNAFLNRALWTSWYFGVNPCWHIILFVQIFRFLKRGRGILENQDPNGGYGKIVTIIWGFYLFIWYSLELF